MYAPASQELTYQMTHLNASLANGDYLTFFWFKTDLDSDQTKKVSTFLHLIFQSVVPLCLLKCKRFEMNCLKTTSVSICNYCNSSVFFWRNNHGAAVCYCAYQ